MQTSAQALYGSVEAARAKELVDDALARHPHETGQLLNVLNDVQGTYRYLPGEAIERIAERMDVPVDQIVRMGDFFGNLSLDPVGRCIIDVCDGTACHTLGAARLVAEFEKKLGIKAGETTPDGLITLRTVGCVGACGRAPVVVVEGDAYGRVRVTHVPEIATMAVQRAQDMPEDSAEEQVVAKGAQVTGASQDEAARASSEAAAACAGARALEQLRAEGAKRLNPDTARITVGMGTCGIAAGAREMMAALAAEQPNALLASVGCRGLCYAEPLVEVSFPSGERALFGGVDASKAPAIAQLVAAGSLDGMPEELAEFLVDNAFVDGQERRVLSHCGIVDPCSLAEYVALGGYEALQRALSLEPSSIIDEVETAQVRGRGGAGFPAGKKWRACVEGSGQVQGSPATDASSGAEPVRYFIVNGDEGDPGAYMDRGLLESDPHRVLEGLIIACYATGVHQAYFFIRAEYPLAVQTVQTALDDARAAGLLGDDILGSGFSLNVDIVRGAGAFLCGESTAMVNVLENGECTTRPKPPHLTEKGLWGAPTCINNVETLANVSLVIQHGAQWFRSCGTPDSPGTKVFSVTGSVERGGLVEVPLGTPLGVIVSGIAGAANPKAVQIGGPSGAILPASLVDLPVSFEGLAGVNGMMGSGGFVVIGTDQCVVDTASYLVHFSAGQSCRKCKPCRDGLDESALIFERITAGQGTLDDLERLEQIAERNCSSKLCGLGRTSLSPVLSSLHYFRDEYEAHLNGCCPGLVCNDLVSYVIDEKLCQGERCCLLTCPGNAVKGRFGKPGHIVGRLCHKCGMCIVSCPYGAVRKVSPAVKV